MQTPWGEANYIEQVAEGITVVGTPWHGGYYLSKERLKSVPVAYKEFASKWSKGWGPQWFEEDIAAMAVVLTFPEYFPTVTDEQLLTFEKQLEYYVE